METGLAPPFSRRSLFPGAGIIGFFIPFGSLDLGQRLLAFVKSDH